MPQPPSLEVYVRDRIATLQSSVSRVKTRPHAISQLHSAGALLFHYPVFMPAPAWELLHVGNQCDNTRSKLRTFKLTSLSSFPGWLMESFTCQRSLMSEVTGYCHMVPNEEEFPCSRCGQEDHAVKEVWRGRGPAECRCDLARGG